MIFCCYQEVHNSQQRQKEEIIEKRARASKIRALNDHLEAILQKKIRLDLEIQKIEQKLRKLKSTKSTISEEVYVPSFSPDPVSSEGLSAPRWIEEALVLELQRSDALLDEVAEIRPYLIQKNQE